MRNHIATVAAAFFVAVAAACGDTHHVIITAPLAPLPPKDTTTHLPLPDSAHPQPAWSKIGGIALEGNGLKSLVMTPTAFFTQGNSGTVYAGTWTMKSDSTITFAQTAKFVPTTGGTASMATNGSLVFLSRGTNQIEAFDGNGTSQYVLNTDNTGNLSEVTGIAVSPDGKLLASIDASCTLAIWDLGTHKLARAKTFLSQTPFNRPCPAGSHPTVAISPSAIGTYYLVNLTTGLSSVSGPVILDQNTQEVKEFGNRGDRGGQTFGNWSGTGKMAVTSGTDSIFVTYEMDLPTTWKQRCAEPMGSLATGVPAVSAGDTLVAMPLQSGNVPIFKAQAGADGHCAEYFNILHASAGAITGAAFQGSNAAERLFLIGSDGYLTAWKAVKP